MHIHQPVRSPPLCRHLIPRPSSPALTRPAMALIRTRKAVTLYRHAWCCGIMTVAPTFPSRPNTILTTVHTSGPRRRCIARSPVLLTLHMVAPGRGRTPRLSATSRRRCRHDTSSLSRTPASRLWSLWQCLRLLVRPRALSFYRRAKVAKIRNRPVRLAKICTNLSPITSAHLHSTRHCRSLCRPRHSRKSRSSPADLAALHVTLHTLPSMASRLPRQDVLSIRRRFRPRARLHSRSPLPARYPAPRHRQRHIHPLLVCNHSCPTRTRLPQSSMHPHQNIPDRTMRRLRSSIRPQRPNTPRPAMHPR